MIKKILLISLCASSLAAIDRDKPLATHYRYEPPKEVIAVHTIARLQFIGILLIGGAGLTGIAAYATLTDMISHGYTREKAEHVTGCSLTACMLAAVGAYCLHHAESMY